MQARDVMSQPVVTVGPETPVADIAELLLERGISAVPVVDTDGALLGIISETDLMHRPELGTQRPARKWWLSLFSAEESSARDYVKTHGLTAKDIMHEGVYTVRPDTPLMDVVAAMEEHAIRRVLVTEDGKLLGIVTRSNILRGFLAGRETAATDQQDRAIRAMVLEELRDQPWATIARNDVLVIDGVVSLWGMVSSEEEREALRVAAENVPGVKRVEDHTRLRFIEPRYWE